MVQIVNVENVTSADFPPSEITPQTAGQWHNRALYNHYSFFNELKGNDSLDVYREVCLAQTQKLITAGLVPSVALEPITEIFDVLQNAQESQGWDVVIERLKQVYDRVNANDTLQNTTICAAVNIGYHSAMFWPEVTLGEEAAKIPWLKILKVVAADVGGALGGAGFGVIWGVIGGVAGSVGAL